MSSAASFSLLLHQALRQRRIVILQHSFALAAQDMTGWSMPSPPWGTLRVLRYLGRYTHRVAISNHRLLTFDGERVTFRWKDYAHGYKQRMMTLTATEFLRRFFQHVLPRGFVRIRYFGFLANAHRTSLLALARQLLGCPSGQFASSQLRVGLLALPTCGAKMNVRPNLTPQELAFVVLPDSS